MLRKGDYIAQLVRFAPICIKVSDFNARILHLTGKLLSQKLNIKVFKFYNRYKDIKQKSDCKYRILYDKGYHILRSMETLNMRLANFKMIHCNLLFR